MHPTNSLKGKCEKSENSLLNSKYYEDLFEKLNEKSENDMSISEAFPNDESEANLSPILDGYLDMPINYNDVELNENTEWNQAIDSSSYLDVSMGVDDCPGDACSVHDVINESPNSSMELTDCSKICSNEYPQGPIDLDPIRKDDMVNKSSSLNSSMELTDCDFGQIYSNGCRQCSKNSGGFPGPYSPNDSVPSLNSSMQLSDSDKTNSCVNSSKYLDSSMDLYDSLSNLRSSIDLSDDNKITQSTDSSSLSDVTMGLNESEEELVNNFICETPKQKPCLNSSILKGWEKVKTLNDPQKNLMLTPPRYGEFNLYPTFDDKYVMGYVWVCNMSEQFYYDNALLLIAHKLGDDEKVKQSLRINYLASNYEMIKDRWVNIKLLGSGGFGEVYKVVDNQTNEAYAVKYQKSIGDIARLSYHTEKILEYLQERNYLIRCHSSPFIMKFLYSFTFTNINGLFLVCEYCISDLSKLLRLIQKLVFVDFESLMTNRLYDGGLVTVWEELGAMFECSFEDVVFIYIFEIFCGLDFLGKVNVVHQDIKPMNILIDVNGHLKFADMGLVFNTHFITRPSQVYLSEHPEFDMFQEMNDQVRFPGTTRYQDYEILFAKSILDRKPDVEKMLRDEDKPITRDALPNTRLDAEPSFMSDTWSAALTVFEVLFINYEVINTENLGCDIKDDLGWDDNFILNTLKTFYYRDNFEKYVSFGILNALGPDYRQFAIFLRSLFLPRAHRGVNYRYTKELARYQYSTMGDILDIEKIEKIDTFAKKNLKHTNVFMIHMPAMLIRTLGNKEGAVKYRTCTEWFAKLASDKQSEQFFDLKPGYDFKM